MEILERKVAFDYLRILASFGVIVLHLCAQNWKYINVYSRELTNILTCFIVLLLQIPMA